MNPELGPKAVIAMVTVGLVIVSMLVLWDTNTPAGAAMRQAVRRSIRSIEDFIIGFIPAIFMGMAWMITTPIRGKSTYKARHGL